MAPKETSEPKQAKPLRVATSGAGKKLAAPRSDLLAGGDDCYRLYGRDGPEDGIRLVRHPCELLRGNGEIARTAGRCQRGPHEAETLVVRVCDRRDRGDEEGGQHKKAARRQGHRATRVRDSRTTCQTCAARGPGIVCEIARPCRTLAR